MYNKGMDKDIKVIDVITKSEIEKSVDDKRCSKRKICDAYIGKTRYDVFELSLKESLVIDRMFKMQGITDSEIILSMLKISIPDCPEEDLLNLTQSQSSELLNLIKVASVQNKLMDHKTLH